MIKTVLFRLERFLANGAVVLDGAIGWKNKAHQNRRRGGKKTNSITFDQRNVRGDFERSSLGFRCFFVGAHGRRRAQVITSSSSSLGFRRYRANARPSPSMRCRGDDRTLHADRTWLSAFNEITIMVMVNGGGK